MTARWPQMHRTVFLPWLVGAVVSAGLPSPQSSAQEIAGAAGALDSDKIVIDSLRINIWGIDGPEIDQDRGCTGNNRPFACWTAAHRYLETLVDEGAVSCTHSGEADPFNRPFMICAVGGKDIGEEMVRAGWALAARLQTDRYVAAEEAAKAAKVGLWQDGVQFALPWKWREAFGG